MTSVAMAHVEYLGNLDGVARAKGGLGIEVVGHATRLHGEAHVSPRRAAPLDRRASVPHR